MEQRKTFRFLQYGTGTSTASYNLCTGTYLFEEYLAHTNRIFHIHIR